MAHLSPKILVNFYRCTVESILTNCATVWFGGCSVDDRKALQRVMKTAQHITGAQLPAIVDLQRKRNPSSGTLHIHATNCLPSYHQAGGTGLYVPALAGSRTVSFQLL